MRAVAQSVTMRDPKPIGVGAVAAQVSTGFIGTAAGFVGGGLATRWAAQRLGRDEETRGRTALVGAYTTAVFTTAIGPTLIGSRGTSRGSFPAAIGGAAGGLAVSALLRKIGKKGVFGERGPVAIVVGAMIFTLPSIGSTWAYNNTR